MATFKDKMTQIMEQYERMEKLLAQQAEKIEWLEEENNLLHCEAVNHKKVNENMKSHFDEAKQMMEEQIQDLKAELEKVKSEREALDSEKQAKMEYQRQYREQNRETLNEKVKEYKKKNKEKVDAQKASPTKCGCGSIVRSDNYSRHCETSKKHKKWLESKAAPADPVTV
jgi:primase-polymerase (primpol)-like protein